MRAVTQSLAARFESLHARFSADVRHGLRPYQLGKIGRNTSLFHKGVRHVDLKLKSHGEAVVQQAGGDEETLRVAGIDIPMARRLSRKAAVKALRDQGSLAIAAGQPPKVRLLAADRSCHAGSHGLPHAL